MSLPLCTRAMSETWKYAVIDDDGRRLAVLGDPFTAYSWAAEHGFDDVIFRQGRPAALREQNPLGEGGPAAAWAALGNLRIKLSEVEKLTLKDAYRVIMAQRMPALGANYELLDEQVPVWPRGRRTGGRVVESYETPEGAAKALLTTNAKLSKAHPRLRGRVAGLALLPAGLIRGQEIDGPGVLGRVRNLTTRTTLCVGSTPECRSSCLVYTGTNVIDPYNTRIKEAKTATLLAEPIAFGRLLLESVRLWTGIWPRRRRKVDRQPFARLNVFSDVPWELVFPELFLAVPAANFYDYTKVPMRPELCAQVQSDQHQRVFRFPGNYHLTFSSSGTNDADCAREMQLGRSVAVVFSTRAHKAPQLWQPPFWHSALPVIDADLHDMRPVDPGATQLIRARAEVGYWRTDMDAKERERRISEATGVAYDLTFPDGFPPSVRDLPARQPCIVGLTYKTVMDAGAQERMVESQAMMKQAASRSRVRRRAFLVPVMEKGMQIVGPDCPPTVAFVSPQVPGETPGVVAMSNDDLVDRPIAVAAKTASSRRRTRTSR